MRRKLDRSKDGMRDFLSMLDVGNLLHSRWFMLAWALAVGAGVGISSVGITLESGYAARAFREGPWIGWPSAGLSSENPYARAAVARSSGALVGGSEGLALFANRDSEARPLLGTCSYVLEGQFLNARWWTLSVYDRKGQSESESWERRQIASSEIVRRHDYSFRISISSRPQAGVWMPVAASGPLVIVFRLYDADVLAFERNANLPLPRIVRRECAA